MHHVHILQSLVDPSRVYTGLCADVPSRLMAHNSGQPSLTSKYKPWKLLSFHYFERGDAAAAFERNLKSGSGRAFARKRLL